MERKHLSVVFNCIPTIYGVSYDPSYPPPPSIGWLGYKEVTLSILAKTDTMYHHYKRVYWYSLLLAQNNQVTITEKVFTLFMTKNAGSVIYCKLPRSKLIITTIFQTMHVQFFFYFFFFGGGRWDRNWIDKCRYYEQLFKGRAKMKRTDSIRKFSITEFHVIERISSSLAKGEREEKRIVTLG